MSLRKHKLTIDLPEELLILCDSDMTTPETVLRGFIADLCGIMNWASAPRSDGYSSNGSDERWLVSVSGDLVTRFQKSLSPARRSQSGRRVAKNLS